jgi:hypothetical protein
MNKRLEAGLVLGITSRLLTLSMPQQKGSPLCLDQSWNSR